MPPPKHPLVTRLDEPQAAELIERHIEHVDETGRPVHLPRPFVIHYLQRGDGVLPRVAAVATLPTVTTAGAVLSGHGLHRETGIVFRISDALLKALPRREDCTSVNVADAMHFLTHEWLCDVSTDYAGKCVAIASALTIIERLVLPERPAFFVTAGQRGGGKTTLVHMISTAVLGRAAAAAPWSPIPEERRKALLAYLSAGVPLIAWDNIPRGGTISCPFVEMASTSATYEDRVLGETERREVPATAVHFFTGNNVVATGDMASRSLTVRLEVDRPDPENRQFIHADPIGWTQANRARILSALYALLLGNPRLGTKIGPDTPTRFKTWWHLIGSAVEHASQVAGIEDVFKGREPPPAFCFQDMFLAGEFGDEQSNGLAEVLDMLRVRFSGGFSAADVASAINVDLDIGLALKELLEQASGKTLRMPVNGRAVAWALKAVVDTPAVIGGRINALRFRSGHEGGTYRVAAT